MDVCSSFHNLQQPSKVYIRGKILLWYLFERYRQWTANHFAFWLWVSLYQCALASITDTSADGGGIRGLSGARSFSARL